jgi:glycine betaine/proline transport system substrate-binding protein
MKRMILATAFIAVILAVAPATVSSAEQNTLKLAYVEWSSEIASANLVRAVLMEKLGINCDIIPMEADKMWESVAQGTSDATVAAWLPQTHGHYLNAVRENVEALGPNLEGARIGLVVPNFSVGRQTMGSGLRNKPYIEAESIADLKKYAGRFKRKIIGIAPAAGVMKKTREAITAYGLTEYRLVSGSEISMTAELSNAIRKQQWIVATGWIPHWMFGRWDMRFLKDPKNVFGDAERIETVVRKGLKQDMPKAYKFLDQFYWTPDEMDQLMVWIKDDEGMYPYEKALRWLRYNEDRVKSWLE